jgi:hypothetical protein
MKGLRASVAKVSRLLVAPLLLVALVLGFYWKLTLTRDYTWLDTPDLAYQVLPWFQFQATEVHQGRLPLWDPHHWGGQSLVGQVQPGVVNPLNWVLFSFRLRDGLLRWRYLDFYFLLVHCMGAVFAYALCRDLERTKAASVLAGSLYSLGGFFGTVKWPGVMNGLVWVPLVFLFLLRAAKGRRSVSSAALSGVCLGIAFLGGHHLVQMLTLLAGVGFWIFVMFRSRRLDLRAVKLAAIFLLFTMFVGAAQILPALEYGSRAIRWVGAPDAIDWNQRVPYSVHSEFSLQASSLLGILTPGIFRHENPFIGVTAVSLALLGLALGWRHRTVRVLAAIALGGLLYSLGRDNVFYGLLYALVPMIEKAREPAFAIFLFHFGVAALAAYGCDELRKGEVWLRRAAFVLVTAGSLTLMLCLGMAMANRYQITFDQRVVLTGFTSLLLSGILYGAYRGNLSSGSRSVCVVGLLLVELGYGSGPALSEMAQAKNLQTLNRGSDAAAFIRSQSPHARVEVDDEDLPYNFGDWHGLNDMGGYLVSVPRNTWRMGALADLRALYGVAYSVTKKPPSGAQQLAYESPSGLKVYRNTGAFPRLWTVHETVSIRHGGGVESGLDLHKTAFMAAPAPQLESCPGEDQVRIVEYLPSRVVIETDMKCKGIVVLSDNDYPGWRASVDNLQADILPAYISMRGVAVPAGHHRIEMDYRPVSVFLGATLTVQGLLAAAALAAWDVRRSRGRPADPSEMAV